MNNAVTVTFPHTLGADEAKNRANTAAQAMAEKYAAFLSEREIVWSGHRAEFVVGALGQRIRGSLDIEPHSATLTVLLPLILAPMRRKVEDFLKSNANQFGLLAPPK